MMDVKRIAKIGERIRVINAIKTEWDDVVIPINSIWTVKKVLLKESKPPGFIFLEGNDSGVFPNDYVVLEK